MTVAPKSKAFQRPGKSRMQGDIDASGTKNTPPEKLIAKLSEVQRQAQQDAQREHLQAAAASVLLFESELRSVKTLLELPFFIANEARGILGAQQICVFEKNHQEKFIAKAISSISVIDRSAPVLHLFERLLAKLGRHQDLIKPAVLDVDAFSSDASDSSEHYPLRFLLWVPYIDCDGTISAGMLLARKMPWTKKDKSIADYVSRAISHTWQSHRQSTRSFRSMKLFTRKRVTIAAIVVMAIGFVPVEMTALAPAEVVPRNPFVVTSGIAGVVESVRVTPNAIVKKGDILAQLDDTVFRNKFELAKREVLVAEASYKKAAQLAFREIRGRHELGVTQAELQVKLAERAYAKTMLERTKIRAGSAGVATFSDAQDLIGTPLNIGEKLMEIANPEKYDFRIQLPAADAIVLKPGARVKVFLDSDPLNSVEARLVRADYRAKRTEMDTLAFRLTAQRRDETLPALRLGVRGTAQVYSDEVSLAFYLFRRPLGVLRQWAGL